MIARHLPKLIFAGLLLICAACVAYDAGPGGYGYAGPGPTYPYATDYPWYSGVGIDISNGYGRGWHPSSGWGHGPARGAYTHPAAAHAHAAGGHDDRSGDDRRR